MEKDDDDQMVVLVIGEVESTGSSGQKCQPVPVKEEPLEECDIQNIMAIAEQFGQPVEIEHAEDNYILPDILDDSLENISSKDVTDIKEEIPDIDDAENQSESNCFKDEEYLNEDEFEALDDEDFEVSQAYNDYVSDSDDPFDKDSGKKSSRKSRTKMLSPSQQKSFIEDLRQQYPELRQNEKALIKSLVEIMRNSRPPTPPNDFYVVNDIMYECVKCGALTSCLPAASRHYQEKHGPRYLVCFACGVDFRSKTNLYKHEKRCLAPDAVVVLKARAMFLGRKARSRPFIPDMRSVPLYKSKYPKSFACVECSAAFTSQAQLTAHVNMHNGVRPYCCDQCPRAYTSMPALTRHLKKHSDQVYICDHCSSSFKIKDALIAHLDTHKAIKKHACGLCPKRYATKNALNHHVRRTHLQLPLPCACVVCPQRYPRMSLLRDHMVKKHGLSLMTRNMFIKALPTLTEEQLQQDKAILKTEQPHRLTDRAALARWLRTCNT